MDQCAASKTTTSTQHYTESQPTGARTDTDSSVNPRHRLAIEVMPRSPMEKQPSNTSRFNDATSNGKSPALQPSIDRQQ